MNELALFAGAGGGILGSKLLGWRTICAVEWEPYAACVLAARQNDGILPPFPIWGDIQTFDGKPWRGIADIVSGGFPCQDISVAGAGDGIEGDRSGLWKEMARVIGEVLPRFVFVENSPALTSRGLGVVLGDLASLGYNAEWGVISAADTGAPHLRERIWILGFRGSKNDHYQMANSISDRLQRFGCEWPAQRPAGLCGGERGDQKQGILADFQDKRDVRRVGGLESIESQDGIYQRSSIDGRWQQWPTEPNVGRVADGMADRVDRLRAIGNGQVPRVVASAWHLLKNE